MTGFDENNIIIPLAVIEELDNIKKESSQRGYAARQTLRNIDELRVDLDIQKGVKRNEKGGLLRVVILNKTEMDSYNKIGFRLDKQDDLIILTASKVKNEDTKIKTIIVSNDTALRIKSTLLDVPAEFYKDITIHKKFLDYNGYRTVVLPLNFFGEIAVKESGEEKWVPRELPPTMELEEVGLSPDDINANEFILLECENDDMLTKKESKQLKCVYRYKQGELHKRNMRFQGLYGNITGRSLEQSCALDLLMDDDVPVVSLKSMAGGGKTFCALSCALTKILKDKNRKYEKIIFLKPTVPIGNDIGFLPGTMYEKLTPYLSSFLDNINLLRKKEMTTTKSSSPDSFEDLLKNGIIEIESISFVRGRNFNNTIIIADEMQNIDSAICKTIMSRIGENCRIFCLGDVDQIDTSYLNSSNNGLAHLIRKFRGNELFGHVTMVKCERSAVAQLAAEIL